MTLPTLFNWECKNCGKVVSSALQSYCRCRGRLVAMVSTDAPPNLGKRVVEPCKHRGAEIHEDGCGCNGSKAVFECAIFGKCVLFKQSCEGCKDAQICSKCDKREE